MDDVEQLLVEVRAGTAGFTSDVTQMRRSFDTILGSGLGEAGQVLERGLLSAVRRGSLGFEDLRHVALSVIGDIAAQAVQAATGGLGGALGGTRGGGLLPGLGSILGSILGLPGRATGGLVTAGRGYLVGERGPEMFVPASSGRIEPNGGSARGARDVRVSINVVAPRGASAPESLQRSSRQVARAVRKALNEY